MEDLALVSELVFMLACDEPDYDVAERRAKKLLKKFEAPYISSYLTRSDYLDEILREWCLEVGLLTMEDFEDETLAPDLEFGLEHVSDLFLKSRKLDKESA